jgi:predicted DNA binding CopG/RHH family protein
VTQIWPRLLKAVSRVALMDKDRKTPIKADTQVRFRLNKADLEALRRKASQQGITTTRLLSRLIRQHLDSE